MTWYYTRQPLSVKSSELLLAPLLCYYVTAILVLLPRTFPIRLAILPTTLFYAFRASTQLDLVGCGDDGRLAYVNQDLLLVMAVLAIRAIIWTFQQNPYQRDHKSSEISLTYPQILLDAADLSLNVRGIGWSWSRLPHVPIESRPFFIFVLHTLVSLVFHLVSADVAHRLAQSLDSTNTIGSPIGGSIFDPSLSPVHRYSRSTLITFLVGLTIYAAIQTAYHLLALFSLIFLRHSPSQWPPLFDRPWLSTSLSQFWSRRWHQLFREIFVSFGGNTVALLMGRVGSILGSFFVSGVLHSFGLWGMGRGGEFVKVTGFFMIMAVGILLERFWKSVTGSRVDGLFGRVWTFFWLLSWGNILIDAWSTKGLIGSAFHPEGSRPSDYILQWWIKS